MKAHLSDLILSALEALQSQGLSIVLPESIHIEATRDKAHGDFATNVALSLAKQTKQNPRSFAEQIVAAIPVSSQVVKIEIAGPGFINFFLNNTAFLQVINDILTQGNQFGKSQLIQNKTALVEFVSSNPTGPLHVGHGRHAAFGAVICNLLEEIGYTVSREYYVNDAGRQMDILAASVWLRYLELCDEKLVLPANMYKGEYIIDIAKNLFAAYHTNFHYAAARIFENLPLDEPQGGDKEIYIDAVIERMRTLLDAEQYDIIFNLSLGMILDDINNDLAEYSVSFDQWFSEKKFVQTDKIEKMFNELKSSNLLYEKEGAVWFASEKLGDDKDRVIQRANGQRTYFANDLAYHVDKFNRGYDLVIDILGADHHGYIPRMQAGMRAFGIDTQKLVFLNVQFVSLYRGAMQLPMSTRSGSFVTLRELRQEVGNDAARFLYVTRKNEQHIDFDLDLAKSRTNENPVFYVQYAYARICSVFRQLEEKQFTFKLAQTEAELSLLTSPQEIAVLMQLAKYKEVIVHAALQYEAHMLTNYVRELANEFHSYYNSHQFIVDDERLRNARLTLIWSIRQVLTNALRLLGVSTPESM